MNLFDVFYVDRKEVLAGFLGVTKNDLKTGEGESYKLLGDQDHDYYVLNDRNGTMEYLGESEGYHIYKN